MVLTRLVFLHRDYLNLYMSVLPKTILDTITNTLNCEDIAMTLLVSSATNGKPPLLVNAWARKTLIKLFQMNAISGGDDVARQEEHRRLRDSCVDTFAAMLDLKEGASQLKKERFLVQHLKNEYYDSAPFSDEDQVPIESFVERERRLVKQWNKSASKRASIKEWVQEASADAKGKGLITKTEEWERRWRTVIRGVDKTSA